MAEGEGIERRGPWGWIQPWDLEAWGPALLDDEARSAWLGAFRIAGGLPYMWRELAPQISQIAYALLELREGDRVLLIGEAVEPCGWASQMRALVGESGSVDAFDIIEEARAAVFGGSRGRNGKYGCWQWQHTREAADSSYDAVAVMQAHQHHDDWVEAAAELTRVLAPGRRIVLAEAQLSGPTFWNRVNADVHVRQWVDKAFSTFPIAPAEIPFYTLEELGDAFRPWLADLYTMEWHGIEMLWGRKPATA